MNTSIVVPDDHARTCAETTEHLQFLLMESRELRGDLRAAIQQLRDGADRYAQAVADFRGL